MWVAAERILLTLWVGSLWTSGYIVAPVLFKSLDRMTAGSVAGQLFTIVSYVGLFVVTVLLLRAVIPAGLSAWGSWRNRILFAMLLLIVMGQFFLQPLMVELKAAGLTGSHAKQFAALHGVASILYLINSVLGLVLVSGKITCQGQD